MVTWIAFWIRRESARKFPALDSVYDLFILECLITFFSALAIAQPFVQPFRKIAGLAVLPIIALILSLTSLPAFGFRPELLPLAFFTFISSIGSIPRLTDMARKLRTDDYDGRKLVFAIIKLAMLLCVALFAFIFSPKVDPIGWMEESVVLEDEQGIIMKASELIDESRNVHLDMRFYYLTRQALEGSTSTTAQSKLPMIVVACPIPGGLRFYEEYCTALALRGFLVVAFSRRMDLNFDTVFGSYPDLITSYLFSGRTRDAETIVRAREQDLLSDFGFLIRFLKSVVERNLPEYSAMDDSRISVAGFGAGGAAALMYGAQGFDNKKIEQDCFSILDENSELIASISMEGPPSSFRETEIRMDGAESLIVENPAVIHKVASWITLFFRAIKQKTGFEGFYFVGKVPETCIPSLMIVSDKIGDTDERDGRYAVLLRFLLGAEALSAIISFEGAGILDFTDAPRKYPVLSVFTPGLKPRVGMVNTSYAIEAADASAAFILLAIDRKQSLKENGGASKYEPSSVTRIPSWHEFTTREGVSIELGGEW